MKKKLSFVVPVYNEQESLPLLHTKLCELMEFFAEQYDSEIILVNDGSTDTSWHLIEEFAHRDSRVKGICFTRNFGHQIALTAGYDKASGDAVISLDADLQHPPSLIQQLVRQWEQGYPVVYAKRSKTEEGFFKELTSRLYVWTLNVLSGETFPQGVADFRLLDASVVRELNTCGERFRYIRGAIANLGYSCTFVEYHQPARKEGSSKYTFYKMVALAFNGLICFSTAPLRLLCYFGFVLLFVGFFAVGYVLIKLWALGMPHILYGMGFFLLYVLVGLIFMLLWILSEYLIRMYEFQKRQQPYVVMAEVNFKRGD